MDPLSGSRHALKPGSNQQDTTPKSDLRPGL